MYGYPFHDAVNFLLVPPIPTIFQRLMTWANEKLHAMVSIFHQWMTWTWKDGSSYGFVALALMYAFTYAIFGYSLGHPHTLWSLLCWNITCFVYFQQTQLPGEEDNCEDEEEKKIKNIRHPSILWTGLVALRFGWKAYLAVYGLSYVIYCGKLLYDAAQELKKKRDDEAVIEEEEDQEINRGGGFFIMGGKAKKTKKKTSMFNKDFALEVLCGEEFKGLDRKAFSYWVPRVLYELGLVFVLAAVLPRRLVMVPEEMWRFSMMMTTWFLSAVKAKMTATDCQAVELACVG